MTNHNIKPAIKERPILMSAPMVRAILENRKTQTRRIIKPQPEVNEHGNLCGEWLRKPLAGLILPRLQDIAMHCPYGKIGDMLWVRETYQDTRSPGEPENQRQIIYRADHDLCLIGWKPSIYMPRWASRINLEITNISVERLQDISEEDAIAEGIKRYVVETADGDVAPDNDVIDDYAHLWESINGKGSWDKNPFVWVIEFKRVEEMYKHCKGCVYHHNAGRRDPQMHLKPYNDWCTYHSKQAKNAIGLCRLNNTKEVKNSNQKP